MKALVTGGAGFIGGHLVEMLVEDGWDVIVFDNFERASLETLKALPPEVELRRIDIRDLESMKRYVNDVDVIFHLAALIDVVESEVKRDEYWDVNVVGTRNILEAALGCGSIVVFASSAAVYGDLDKPAREDLKPSPINFYGLTKLEAEKLCLKYHRKGLRISILRLFNVFGERARGGVVKIFLEKALHGEPLIIYGDGEAVRDFIYVKDVAEAFLRASREEKAFGEVINIGSGKPVKIRELAELVSTLTGVEIKYVKRRSGEILFSLADISKAKNVLNWTPKVRLSKWIESKLK